MAGPVQGVGADVGLHVLASSLHDETDDDEDKHENETLDTAPDVNDLGQGQGTAAAENGSDNADAGQETVLVEAGCDVGVEGALNGDEQGVNEGNQVKPGQLVLAGCKTKGFAEPV